MIQDSSSRSVIAWVGRQTTDKYKTDCEICSKKTEKEVSNGVKSVHLLSLPSSLFLFVSLSLPLSFLFCQYACTCTSISFIFSAFPLPPLSLSSFILPPPPPLRLVIQYYYRLKKAKSVLK